MKVYTYEEIRDKVLVDLDLENEDFVDADEMVGYCNEAIHEAESEIHKLHEDYFLTSATISLVQDTSEYSFPSDIYAQKIRALIYQNGSTIYTIRRIRGEWKFYEVALINQNDTTQDYQYLITNASAAAGYKIKFVPAARESGDYVTMWYLRSATRIPLISEGSSAATLATKVDIPEFYTFIIAYMKALCRAKENGGVIPADAAALVEQQRKMMVDTLTQMVPDDDDTVMADFTHYIEHE